MYWDYRDEITIEENLLFKKGKVIIPAKLRKLMLTTLHRCHQGIEKTKRFARDVIFWPGVIAEIHDMVSRCEIRSRHRNCNSKEPLMSHRVPERPWQRVWADLFYEQNKTHLLLVDYVSNFIEISQLTKTTSTTVITCCKQQFSRHGIPETLVTDNGSQFSSAEFRTFSKQYGFVHTASSPHHPQSNGKVERAVQVVKKLLKKAREAGEDPHLALLQYINTSSDTSTLIDLIQTDSLVINKMSFRRQTCFTWLTSWLITKYK